MYVAFDYPPVNILGTYMLNDLNNLFDFLMVDSTIKVVIFESLNKDIFIAHYDIDLLKDLSTDAVIKNNLEPSYLQRTLNRLTELPQATIAKIDGIARGGGHEFAQACDLRYATRENAVFMQMEVGMGIFPCGGGSSRLARQTGLGKALEIILSAKDFDAKKAEKYGSINKALHQNEIDEYVDKLAYRISKFPSDSIKYCKKMVYESIDLPIYKALIEEEYYLYQCTSKTNSVERFKKAYSTNFQNSLDNQKNFESLLMNFQDK